MFLVIDGSSLLVTNYFATLPPALKFEKDPIKQAQLYPYLMQTSNGTYTNAIVGTLRTILSILATRLNIDKLAIVFDKTRNTFRRTIYSEYKANRKPTAKPLSEQFITIEHILSELGLCVLYDDAYEADDLAGSIINKFKSTNDMIFLTKDHDYLQLIDTNVTGWILQSSTEKANAIMNGHNIDTTNIPDKVAIFNNDIVLQEEKVNAIQIIDKKALCGDASDNIPGVPRVGESSVIPLLSHYKTIEDIYTDIDSKPEKELVAFWKSNLGIKTSPYKKLVEYKDLAFMSKKLATIVTNAPVPDDIDTYNCIIDKNKLAAIIDTYELNSLKKFL